jgi:hypothetical protein
MMNVVEKINQMTKAFDNHKKIIEKCKEDIKQINNYLDRVIKFVDPHHFLAKQNRIDDSFNLVTNKFLVWNEAEHDDENWHFRLFYCKQRRNIVEKNDDDDDDDFASSSHLNAYCHEIEQRLEGERGTKQIPLEDCGDYVIMDMHECLVPFLEDMNQYLLHTGWWNKEAGWWNKEEEEEED